MYTVNELNDAEGIFIGICVEFPELYDKYWGKMKNDSDKYKLKMEITEEEKKQAMDKIWKRIEKENLT